ncbi:hypothetical protein FXO38_31848 [Capsicum annuum]|nr:hypothetical protein FXO38_31848 [Capsicum annuum]
MFPAKAMEMVDENTICVVAILSSTLTGAFEDVKFLNEFLTKKNKETGGHKYGLVYAGFGWVIWRSKDDLPDELVFHINYLGSDQPTFTLNFSKGSYQIIDQKFYFLTIKKASRLMNKFGSWPRISCHANTIYVISEFGTVYTIYVDIFE